MRISRTWLTAAVLLGTCFLTWNLLAHAEPAPQDSVPSGLVVVRHVNNSPHQDQQLYDQGLKNPFIRGVAFQIHWSEIEPVEGKPDWSQLDPLFAAAESAKKWVQLCVYAGFFSPAWAFAGREDGTVPGPIWT